MAEKKRGVWVLDSETKGTGAHIAPLRDEARSGPERPLALVDLSPGDAAAQPGASTGQTEVQAPLRLRVIDVMSSRVLADDGDASEAIAALEQLPHAVDALVFVRPADHARWRLLSSAERRTLWGFRRRGAGSATAAADAEG